MSTRSAAVAALLVLAGCKTITPAPEIVQVPVDRYVAVPASLTAPCPVARATARTVEAVVTAYNANITALDACNAQLDGIRNLTATP